MTIITILKKVIPIRGYINQCFTHHFAVMISLGITEQLICLFVNQTKYLTYLLLKPSFLDLFRCVTVEQTFRFYLIKHRNQLYKPVCVIVFAGLVNRLKLIADMTQHIRCSLAGLSLVSSLYIT